MLRTSFIAYMILSCVFPLLVLADAKEDVVAAAKKLADSDSYSWTTTTEGGGGGGGGGGSEGKIQKDGLTMLSLRMRGDTILAYFKGDKGAYSTSDGEWRAIGEDAEERGPGQMIANMIKTYQPPAAQAQHLASVAQDLQKTDDGGYSGTLSADEAKALMQRRVGRRTGGDGAGAGAGAGAGGGGGPEVRDPRATVTFWTDNGTLTKFQFNVQGTMTIQGEDRAINRTTTVELKDVGATKIDVTEEAKAKMQ